MLKWQNEILRFVDCSKQPAQAHKFKCIFEPKSPLTATPSTPTSS